VTVASKLAPKRFLVTYSLILMQGRKSEIKKSTPATDLSGVCEAEICVQSQQWGTRSRGAPATREAWLKPRIGRQEYRMTQRAFFERMPTADLGNGLA